MSDTVNVGIVGAGGMGSRHARNLNDEVAAANVAAIMDVDTPRAQQMADRCGGATLYSDANELIAAPEVDAVVIAAPDRFHAAFTRACIRRGKAVLCEKPLATGGVHINPFKDAIRPIDDVITGSVIHDIHSARWMMGAEIVRVYTSYIPFSPSHPLSARYVMVQLQFDNGALGGLECNSESGYGYEVTVRITGETGVVDTNPLPSPVVRHSNARSQWIEEDWLQRFETAYMKEAQAWVQSIIDGKATGPSAWDGYMSMQVADACIRSARSGQPAEVDLPEKPAIYR